MPGLHLYRVGFEELTHCLHALRVINLLGRSNPDRDFFPVRLEENGPVVLFFPSLLPVIVQNINGVENTIYDWELMAHNANEGEIFPLETVYMQLHEVPAILEHLGLMILNANGPEDDDMPPAYHEFGDVAGIIHTFQVTLGDLPLVNLSEYIDVGPGGNDTDTEDGHDGDGGYEGDNDTYFAVLPGTGVPYFVVG